MSNHVPLSECMRRIKSDGDELGARLRSHGETVRECERVRADLAAGDLRTEIATLRAGIASRDARIAELEAQLNARIDAYEPSGEEAR